MFSAAKWIWSKDQTLFPCHFVFFRRSFHLATGIEETRLLVSADSKYRLWINGKYVGTGPARGKPGHPYVDSYECSARMTPGHNVIAVLVEHYSGGSIIFSPVHGGLVLELQSPQKTLLVTDNNWKCRSAECYSVIPCGYQHLEVFRAELYPEDWQQAGYNDSNWDNASCLNHVKLAAPQQLPARPIPLLTQKVYSAKNIISLGSTSNSQDTASTDLAVSLRDMPRSDVFQLKSHPILHNPTAFPQKGLCIIPAGSFFIEIDMGEEILGTPRFSIETTAATCIDIGYSEVLENNRVNPFRQNIFFAERIISRPGKNVHTIFQPRGFRYLIMRCNTDQPVHIHSIEVVEEIYPDDNPGDFISSDPALNKIFAMCRRTMNLCMEDAFTDCPWRERQQWLGDLFVECKTALYALGATDLCKKALLEFCEIKSGAGWIHAVAPGGTGLNLPGFGMYFPALVWDYYLFTGEYSILSHCYPTIKGMAAFLESIRQDHLIFNDNGIPPEKMWFFVDWTKTDANHSDGALQGLYLYFLRCAAHIARTLQLELDEKSFTAQAEKTRKAIVKAFWSDEKGAFLKYRRDGSSLPAGTPPLLLGQHENFLFPLLNVGSAEQQKSALEAVQGLAGKYLPDLGGKQSYFADDQCGSVADKEIIRLGSPFLSFFALAALFGAGKYHEALEYIKLCWGFIYDNGPGTCWEMWGGGTSLCHGFSTAPVYFIYREILGIVPLEPGFRKIKIAPRNFIPERTSGTLPLIQGRLFLKWENAATEVSIQLEVPESSEVVFFFPEGFHFKKKKSVHFPAGKHVFVLKRHESLLPPPGFKNNFTTNTQKLTIRKKLSDHKE